MTQNLCKLGLSLFLLILSVTGFSQQTTALVVDVDNPKAAVEPTMWGVFFEDINFAADGGLYAELIKNRSFEFYKPLMGWSVEKTAKDSSHLVIINRGELNPRNPRYAHVKVKKDGGLISLTNVGFRGMGVKANNQYRFSFLASVPAGSNVKLRAELLDGNKNVIGTTSITPAGEKWTKYESRFTCSKTDLKASLKIWFEGDGFVDIDMISLFPTDTWKNRENGLRADIVQLLADMKPGFFRFPGGCIVEGRELATRYQWKNTVGNIEDRVGIVNRWNTEFSHRLTPDYFQSFGLGFYEYFLLSEDIGAEPLPIINCGMACQYNTAECVPLDQLGPYVQDALDLIEFANGSINTTWGKVRADMGHPEPFNLKYLGVGNEQWGEQFFERYAIFEKAILEKYPDIKIVGTAGPAPDDDLFHYAQTQLVKFKAPIVDEHYYRPPTWFFDNATRYDNYDRNSFKIFAGEYAAQTVATCSPENQSNWLAALSEAAFMTGLERNADVVSMCSYAPLLAHTEAWQWKPDLIWFDNLTSFGTANYQVQKIFSTNKGTDLLTITKDNVSLVGQEGIYASAVWDETSKEVIIKLVNNNDSPKSISLNLKTKKRLDTNAKLILLTSKSLDDVNSIENPDVVVPVEKQITTKGKSLTANLEPYSLSVIKIKQK